MRRFGGPDKEMRNISRAGKLWLRKTAQRAQARLGFFGARITNGAEHILACFMRRAGLFFSQVIPAKPGA
jgi:hypothetical protein